MISARVLVRVCAQVHMHVSARVRVRLGRVVWYKVSGTAASPENSEQSKMSTWIGTWVWVQISVLVSVGASCSARANGTLWHWCAAPDCVCTDLCTEPSPADSSSAFCWCVLLVRWGGCVVSLLISITRTSSRGGIRAATFTLVTSESKWMLAPMCVHGDGCGRGQWCRCAVLHVGGDAGVIGSRDGTCLSGFVLVTNESICIRSGHMCTDNQTVYCLIVRMWYIHPDNQQRDNCGDFTALNEQERDRMSQIS